MVILALPNVPDAQDRDKKFLKLKLSIGFKPVRIPSSEAWQSGRLH